VADGSLLSAVEAVAEGATLAGSELLGVPELGEPLPALQPARVRPAMRAKAPNMRGAEWMRVMA
jgi:hypothetical protein